jgi:hypothetical protein
MIVDRFVYNSAGGEAGAGFLQSNFQLALPQALIGVSFYHHKPQFAPHAQSHLPFVLQRSLLCLKSRDGCIRLLIASHPEVEAAIPYRTCRPGAIPPAG